jgi:hypothetical protein
LQYAYSDGSEVRKLAVCPTSEVLSSLGWLDDWMDDYTHPNSQKKEATTGFLINDIEPIN